MKTNTAARYRIVVGEGETGHIVDTTAKTEYGARIVLRELAKYAGDGWGCIEIDLYGDGRWQSLD